MSNINDGIMTARPHQRMRLEYQPKPILVKLWVVLLACVLCFYAGYWGRQPHTIIQEKVIPVPVCGDLLPEDDHQ